MRPISDANAPGAGSPCCFASDRLRSGPFEGPAIVMPPALPEDSYFGDGPAMPHIGMHGTQSPRYRRIAHSGEQARRLEFVIAAAPAQALHEHLDGTVSIRFGPHVVGHYTAEGTPLSSNRKPRRAGRGKCGPVEAMENRQAVSHHSHRPLEIPPSRDSHFSTATTVTRQVRPETRKPATANKRGSSGSIS